MKKFILTLLVAFLCVSLDTSAQSAPKQREIYIPCGNLFDISPYGPLSALNVSLKKHPNANRFRVVWDAGASNSTYWATAIYERKRRFLWLENNGEYVSKEDGDNREWTKYVRCWSFQNVTEESLNRLAAKYQKKNNDDEASLTFLPHLTEFGCTKRVLKDWSHISKVP